MPDAALPSLFAGILLAAPAGLNPYLPALFLAVWTFLGGGDRLNPGLDFIGRPWFLGIVAGLFLVNIFLDKIFLPGDSLSTPPARRTRRQWVGAWHDLGQMVLGPLAGALMLVAVCRIFPAHLFLVAPMLGLLLGALAYAGKRFLRRRYAGRLGLFGNIFLSLVEDGVAAACCAGALLVLRA